MEHVTTDLFEAAYMMAEGASLMDVSRAPDGSVVLFELRGERVAALRENYARDQAMTNVRVFQAMLNRAKDVMFSLLRAREIQESRLERRKNHGRREKVGC